jgi:drug/metabolite transporter (DMT)-like permease
MSFIHQSISTFFSFIESNISSKKVGYDEVKTGIPQDQFEKTIFTRIAALSILFTLNIVVGNISLNYCTVAFTQVVRAIIPMITMILSSYLLNQKFTSQQVAACLIICIGVALSCFGEIGLTFKGLVYTVLGCVLSSSKSISIKMVLTGKYTLQSADLLTRISPLSAIEMFALACFDGEPAKILNKSGKYHPTFWCIVGAIISGCMAYFLNLTNFLATHHTSPLTVTIAGCVKQITTIVISVFLFNKKLTMLNVFGIIATTIGSTWYSLLGLKKQKEKEQKKEPELETAIDTGIEFQEVTENLDDTETAKKENQGGIIPQ